MPHPLVVQLRFTRAEWGRALDGVDAATAQQQLGRMNSISWIIGHLAWQEQRYWLWRAQGRIEVPELNTLVGYGQPASNPPLDAMWAAWHTVVTAGDPYLDTLTTADMLSHPITDGQPSPESVGTMIRRLTYHYWFHMGEILAIRQMLGQTGLPEFVGAIGQDAPYTPEPGL